MLQKLYIQFDRKNKKRSTYPSNKSFKFGDGWKVQAFTWVVFPVLIAGKHCKISSAIVVNNIPLLLSKSSLKKCKTVFNMNDDKATILDKEVTLHQSTSGRYCTGILPVFSSKGDTQEVTVFGVDLSQKQKLNQFDKIHKQFGLASLANMEKLIWNANLLNPELSTLIKEVVNSCTTCIKFKKSSCQPIVGLSQAEDSNQTVSIDLHKLKPKLWYMHMADEFTRYSAVAIVSTKTMTAKIFMKHWIAIFGAP